MFLLGINCTSHDTSAAIIKDGKVLFAIEEERLTRIKHDKSFPEKSIAACLKFAKMKINDVDVICIPFDISRQIQLRFLHYWLKSFPEGYKRMVAEFEQVQRLAKIEDEIRQRLNFKKKIYFCHHQKSHMASVYYLSRFTTSALFSIDGCGDIESSSVGEAQGNTIKIFDGYSVEWPHSIGSLYTSITDYLGFIPHYDEGKIMGLAPYGDPRIFGPVFEEIVQLKDNGTFRFNLDHLEYPFRRHSNMSEKFTELCGPRRKPKTKITKRHRDIAAALQNITEKTMLHIANNIYRLTKNENLCLAGGVALNCVANGEILRKTSFKNIFVQPAAHDAGTAIGAALYYYYLNNPDGKRYQLNNAYLGNEYSDRRIENILRKKDISFIKSKESLKKIAQYIAHGKIIAWFNGRMEFGPRALGNRSILTAPFPAKMKNILNKRVKHRESFRPFAPSVLLEDCEKYFDCFHESPYMLLAYNVKKEWIPKIPAITHVDGTARVQTVSKTENPDYYKLISEFKKITGIGLVLNTSFNVMGQPIIDTPEQAIDCFLSTDIDYLVLNGKYIVEKSKEKSL